MKLFLCGDVMTGRGIDQILAHPCDASIHEPYARSALDYVELAEAVNGPIPRNVTPAYIWGDALEVLDRVRPDARIVNLETAVTASPEWERKGINYRMHPTNVSCLTAARLDCCVLANNHVLDWGEAGLVETLETLQDAGLRIAGAGRNESQADAPAVIPLDADRRLLVFAFGFESSGIPAYWAAGLERAGVAFIPDLDIARVAPIAARVKRAERPGDIVMASIHWGDNWGYRIHRDELAFAHALIDGAGVDLIHGHSSHHPKALAVYHGKLVVWGCGDFINDYEGISGHESFRPDLGVMYLPALDDASGDLIGLELVATRREKFQVRLATAHDTRWLSSLLDRESARFGLSTQVGTGSRMTVRW
jgi:poly-gamma-glutamate synthesis protein (capsule biosynthesis protein)